MSSIEDMMKDVPDSEFRDLWFDLGSVLSMFARINQQVQNPVLYGYATVLEAMGRMSSDLTSKYQEDKQEG
jgi:hypothetical protein